MVIILNSFNSYAKLYKPKICFNLMPCKNCKQDPVISLTNNKLSLCKSCFLRYLERKVAKTISKYKLLENNDKVGVAFSGGKDSMTCLYTLNKLAEKKRDLNLVVIAFDEGIKGYRNWDYIKKFCNDNKLQLKIYSFKEELGFTLDEVAKKTKLKPCSICGVLKRSLLNKKARELKLDKLVTGHNLDDESQSVLMNQFKGNLERSARLGPITGVKKDKRFIPRIKPLYFLLEKETKLYTQIKNLKVDYRRCPYRCVSLRNNVADFLDKFEEKYPGTKNAVINSFLELLPILKKKYSETEIKTCKKCKEPCSQEVCKVCELLEKLKVVKE